MDGEIKYVLDNISKDIRSIYDGIIHLSYITNLTYDEILAHVAKTKDYYTMTDYLKFFIDKAALR